MKKAMIYAYTANNLGDDLFIHILCTRYPKTKFLLYAPRKYEQTFAFIANLHIIPNDRFITKVMHKLLKVFTYRERIAKKCDVAIYIGGSLFIEKTNWKKDVENTQSMMRQNQPFFILGANFGPFNTDGFYDTYERLFRTCTDVCFRDQVSYDLFQTLPNVRQAADVVFQLPNEGTTYTEKRILISVIYPSIRSNLTQYDKNYFTAIASITVFCIENGFEIMFMSFCEREKDHLAIHEIIARIPTKYKEKIHTYFYKTNIREALQHIARAKAIIATRFHAMILGWVYEKPVFPIIYSNKMKTVMDDNGFMGEFIKIEEIHRVEPEKVLHALYAPPFDITEQRKDAVQQFHILDGFLN